jgi:hypothetical protein
MALKWINDQYLPLLVFAIFWLIGGLYVVVKPRGFLERTQAPWTKLPVWAARLLGIAS